MRVTLSSVALSLVLISGCKAGASDYSLIGTWVTADNPIPAGCNSKVVFTEMTMYFESPAIPNLMPASKGTVNVLYGGDPKNPKQQASALRKSDPLVLARSDPGQEQHRKR